MTATPSLYWYDLETFGIDPKRDRISQFAGLRTDLDLNYISDPLVMYCKQSNDMLPSPESCLVTGITPQLANREGIIETEFIASINKEFSKSNTCVTGYNNLRFDDEFVRYTLYRNFNDPYEREWKNGNSRWDIIDMVRLTRALRPEGVEWPTHPDGLPSFRLEELTKANNIQHQNAHDALSDIYATIAMAKLIKQKQKKLFDYIFSLRNKHEVFAQLNVKEQKPVLHVSGMFPSKYFCTTIVVPIVQHPINKNGIVVYDLREDPSPLLDLGVDEIRERVFTPKDQLPEGVQRIPLKTIHANKCPIVSPVSTLDENSMERIQLDMAICTKHLALIQGDPQLRQKILKVFNYKNYTETDDPDQQLYQGFFNEQDKSTMRQIHKTSPTDLGTTEFFFNDKRMNEMLFRFRARNYPEHLTQEENTAWEKYRLYRLTDENGGGSIQLHEYYQLLDEKEKNPDTTQKQLEIISELRRYAESLLCEN